MTHTSVEDRITVMDNSWGSYCNQIQKQINHAELLLSQRFNYFLLMTSFLMIAFVTIVSSDRFATHLVNNYARIALAIGIVGSLLSYCFSIANFINARLIYDMGLFLRKVTSSGSINILPSFNSYVSDKLVPQHRFRIGYFWSVYLNTIAFMFRTTIESPVSDTKSTSYMDASPYTWLTPTLIAFVWLIICLITFLDCSRSVEWWYPPLAIGIFSILVGLVIRIRVRSWGKAK